MIGGYTQGNPFDALIVGCYGDNQLQFVAKVKPASCRMFRREDYQRLSGLETDKCPFANLPEKRRTWGALTAEEMKNC